jgi:hypothetical protein
MSTYIHGRHITAQCFVRRNIPTWVGVLYAQNNNSKVCWNNIFRTKSVRINSVIAKSVRIKADRTKSVRTKADRTKSVRTKYVRTKSARTKFDFMHSHKERKETLTRTYCGLG